MTNLKIVFVAFIFAVFLSKSTARFDYTDCVKAAGFDLAAQGNCLTKKLDSVTGKLTNCTTNAGTDTDKIGECFESITGGANTRVINIVTGILGLVIAGHFY